MPNKEYPVFRPMKLLMKYASIAVAVSVMIVAMLLIIAKTFDNNRQQSDATQSDHDDVSTFHEFAFEGNHQAVTKMIESGTDIESEDSMGYNGLTWAVLGGHVDIVKELIEAGLNVDQIGRDGMTPIFHAVRINRNDIVQTLIEGGADPSFITESAPLSTPLMLATERGFLQISQTLVAAGADPYWQNQSGLSAYSVAEQLSRSEFIEYFKARTDQE